MKWVRPQFIHPLVAGVGGGDRLGPPYGGLAGCYLSVTRHGQGDFTPGPRKAATRTSQCSLLLLARQRVAFGKLAQGSTGDFLAWPKLKRSIFYPHLPSSDPKEDIWGPYTTP